MRIKKIFIILSLFLLTLVMAGCKKTKSFANSYLSLKSVIELDITTDDKGKVKSIISHNEQSHVLATSSELMGKDLLETLELMVVDATNKGILTNSKDTTIYYSFLKGSDNTINIQNELNSLHGATKAKYTFKEAKEVYDENLKSFLDYHLIDLAKLSLISNVMKLDSSLLFDNLKQMEIKALLTKLDKLYEESRGKFSGTLEDILIYRNIQSFLSQNEDIRIFEVLKKLNPEASEIKEAFKLNDEEAENLLKIFKTYRDELLDLSLLRFDYSSLKLAETDVNSYLQIKARLKETEKVIFELLALRETAVERNEHITEVMEKLVFAFKRFVSLKEDLQKKEYTLLTLIINPNKQTFDEGEIPSIINTDGKLKLVYVYDELHKVKKVLDSFTEEIKKYELNSDKFLTLFSEAKKYTKVLKPFIDLKNTLIKDEEKIRNRKLSFYEGLSYTLNTNK